MTEIPEEQRQVSAGRWMILGYIALTGGTMLHSVLAMLGQHTWPGLVVMAAGGITGFAALYRAEPGL